MNEVDYSLMAGSRTRHVFVRDLQVMATVGVLEHEKLAPQKLIISVDLTVRESRNGLEDQLENVVCYGNVVDNIKSIIARGHVNLIETLAELIAASALEDRRVLATRVRIEKPDIIPECSSVGIEIKRLQTA